LPFGLAPAVAFAHTFNDAPHVAWTWEPWVLLCLCAAGAGYALGLYRLHTEGRRPTALGGAHPWAFVAGIAVLLIALDSPLDEMSEQLFAAHMTQHLLLMLAAPPLLIWSRPLSAWLWAFPAAQRRWIGRAWLRSGPLIRTIQFLSRPIPAWLACAGALWLWHLPGPYQVALAHPGVHVLEHTSFFVTSLMFWNVALNPRSTVLGAGGVLLFVATFALQNGLFGALLAFAGRPFYAAHVHTTVAWNLTPLQDQQLAGLIMWIPAGTVHLLALSVLFVQWLQSAERNAARRAYTVPGPRRSGNPAQELADV
jgi:cytochrome c oxidase assembly factor CtaG